MNSIQFGSNFGYAQAKERVAQLEQLLGMNESTESSNAPISSATNEQSNSFNTLLQNSVNGPQPLQGTIGGDATNPLSPLSPFAPGISVSGYSNGAVKQLISRIAIQNGLDPSLLDALVKQESDYNPMSRSSAGAMGLTQLMPQTASDMGVQNPFDPEQNLAGGAKYLKEMIKQFGSVPLALAAYNAGPHAVQKYGGIPPYKETQNYVRKILEHIQVNQ